MKFHSRKSFQRKPMPVAIKIAIKVIGKNSGTSLFVFTNFGIMQEVVFFNSVPFTKLVKYTKRLAITPIAVIVLKSFEVKR
jgi:hypothetical protein